MVKRYIKRTFLAKNFIVFINNTADNNKIIIIENIKKINENLLKI